MASQSSCEEVVVRASKPAIVRDIDSLHKVIGG